MAFHEISTEFHGPMVILWNIPWDFFESFMGTMTLQRKMHDLACLLPMETHGVVTHETMDANGKAL